MENPIVWALIATLGTWAVTAAGAATVFLFRRPSPEAMNRMLGFSAGVMIAASFWSLLQPAIARAAEQDGLPPWLVATLGFLLGAVFLWASDRVVTRASSRPGRGSGTNHVVLLILAITLHNIPEGLAVGVAFGALQRGAAPEAVMGAISIAFGIGLQNFPEGAIISMPLKASGMGSWKSFFGGFLSGVVEPIGAVLTILLTSLVVPLLPCFLSFAAGAMIYVVVEELIPEMSAGEHSDIGVVSFAVGFMVMMALDVALG